MGDLKGALLDSDFAIRDLEDNAKAFFRQGQVGSYMRAIVYFSSSGLLYCVDYLI